MAATRESKQKLADKIVGVLARRHSTAVVLFQHAVAERLGLGPTDHKCLDLLRERGAMAGSDLGAISGRTSGAITGVVARLEQGGYLRREPDPHDGRKQILHLALAPAHIPDVIAPLRKDVAALLENFDTHHLRNQGAAGGDAPKLRVTALTVRGSSFLLASFPFRPCNALQLP